MNRRRALAIVALAPLASRPLAQAPLPRIAFLSSANPDVNAAYLDAFRQGLKEHGYEEGRNVVVEYRFADFKFAELRPLARAIVASRPDVVVTQVTEASVAMREATRTIPHVFIGVGDPVASGLVANLSRPGGNVTGNSAMTVDTAAKTVALLKEAVPSLMRAAVLWNPGNATYQRQLLDEVDRATKALGVATRRYPMGDREAIDRAFADMARDRVGGVIVLSDPVVRQLGEHIASRARQAKLPSICGVDFYAAQGGMIGYGPDFPALFRDAAEPVARILRGAKPGDIAIARPTRFALVVNARAAREIGVALPPAFALRADRVIE